MKVKSSITLERWNEGGYKEYRIPGIIVTEKGTILCCYEARMSDSSDWAKIDIKLARSTDQGKTFSKKIIVKGPPDRTITYNNPILIAHEDSVHLIWHQDYSRAFHQVSFDDGETFSEPADITYAFEEFRSRYDWTVIASGPGHGIVLDNGRIIVPVWLAKGRSLVESGRVKEHFPSVVSTIYSDDGGGTWHGGSIISDLDSGNETTAVQLSNGNVLLNMRHRGEPRYRGISISPNGTDNFTKTFYDESLPDPMCFGSLCKTQGGKILFVNCANNADNARINLTLRLSEDDCKSWTDKIAVDPVGGYADIACSGEETVYCFYERRVPKFGKAVIEELKLCRISLK
ncbi:MAG: exo-alpha-sialidase [Clostridiales bacterium]|jgi:sialidase-1|nr:exo-alpha-sialidase [Clostridiales bacterium]